jgi:hypothetical protein
LSTCIGKAVVAVAVSGRADCEKGFDIWRHQYSDHYQTSFGDGYCAVHPPNIGCMRIIGNEQVKIPSPKEKTLACSSEFLFIIRRALSSL